MLLIGYAYPPASVPLLIPFQGYPFGLALWITLNVGALLTALWAIVSRAWPTYRLLAFALALAGLAMFPPFLAGLIAMSTNVGLAGAIGWVAVGLTARQAGVLGGVLGILKVFAGALTFGSPDGKTRAFATAIVVTVAVALVTLPIVGPQSWLDFGTALTAAEPDCSGFNVSIACTLGPTIGLGWGSLVGVIIGGLAVLGMLACRQPYLLSVLAAVAVMAPANNLHIHYWTIGYVLVVAEPGQAHCARPAADTALRAVDGIGLVMGLNRLWVFLAVALPVLAALLATMSTVDLDVSPARRRRDPATRAIPHVDTWTFTAAGLPWVDQQWGAQVVLAVVERLAGWTGPRPAPRGARPASIFACVLLIGLRRGLDARTAALLTLVAFVVAAPALALRPQLLGMACFALVLVLVVDRRGAPAPPVARAGPRRVWANLHGSFFLGPVVLGLAWLEDLARWRRRRRTEPSLVAVVSAAAACLTRSGRRYGCMPSALSIEPGGHLPDHRVAADVHARRARDPVLRLGARGRRAARRAAAAPTSWPTLAWLGVFFVDRALRATRPRLVAARGRGGRRRHAHHGIRGPGARDTPLDPPPQRWSSPAV